MPSPTTRRSRLRSTLTRSAALLLAAALALPSASVNADDDERDGAKHLWQMMRGLRLIDLSHTWDKLSPIAGVNPPFSMALAATHAGTRGAFGDGGQLSFTSEVMEWSGQHGAPSIDAIGHIGRDGKLFGGVDAAESTRNPDGLGASGTGAHLAIDKFPNVGNDTLTFEQRPPITTTPKFQVFPVHMRLISDAGIYVVENLNLEELSAARAYEFTVVMPPLKVKGGTGSALRAFALVPRHVR